MTLQVAEPRTKRWTREEYYRLAQDGWFRGQRVQLIQGEIIQMPPQGHEHAVSIMRITRWLHQVCGNSLLVRCQMPLNALEDSEPEPDLAVIPGPIEAMSDHPRTALLAIEVSDSSRALDRRKASLYAAAGVREYWIVDVQARIVEAYREPRADPSAEFGFNYPPPVTLNEHDSVSPLAIPSATVRVAELLPWTT